MRVLRNSFLPKISEGHSTEPLQYQDSQKNLLLCPEFWRLFNGNKNALMRKVSKLLQDGASVLTTDRNKMTALNFAVMSHVDSKVIELLLKNNASVWHGDKYGMTPLHQAIKSKASFEVLKLLVDNNSDVGARDNKYMTPLHHAAIYNSDPKLVTILMEKGANVNALDWQKMTPLHYAARYNADYKLVSLLLKNRASVLIRTNNKLSALHLAIIGGASIMVIILLLKYDDLNAAIYFSELNSRLTPLHYAVVHKSSPNLIRILLNKGANVNHKNMYNRTPLEMALETSSCFEVVELLIEKSPEIAEYLVNNGCSFRYYDLSGLKVDAEKYPRLADLAAKDLAAKAKV